MQVSPVIRNLSLFTCLLVVVSCASGPQRSVARTQLDFGQAFEASMEAAYDIGFSVASSDGQAGRIVAEQGVSGGGKVTRINIAVKRTTQGTEISAVFIQPPGTISYGDYGIQSYQDALKSRVPDIEFVSAPAS